MKEKKCPHCQKTKPLTREYWRVNGKTKNNEPIFKWICKGCCTTYYRDYVRNRDRLNRQAGYRRKERMAYNKEYIANIRREVMVYYSKGTPKCACCGEQSIEFLAIDHINGDGAEHRKNILKGRHICIWLKNNGFPEGFRVLCHNCNLARAFYGYCPHEIASTQIA